MELLTPAFQTVALVILVGGAAKVVAPGGFAGLLTTFRVPAPKAVAVAAGVVEVVLGAVALVVAGPWTALAVAVAYLVFAGTVLLARRRGAPDCGCFGAVAAPPSGLHVVLNLVAAAVALGAAAVAGGPAPVLDVLGDQPLLGVPYVVLLGLATWLVVVLDTTGAVVLDRISSVAALGPTFRANAATAGVGHRHGGRARRRGTT
jgi:hypothetical protein